MHICKIYACKTYSICYGAEDNEIKGILMPKISVLMPIWNTKIAYLKAAIESVLNQTFSDFEFIILNDSPENKELSAFVSTFNDKRIKYVENPQTLGVAASYNRLVGLASSEYIAMMNHDDISMPERLQRQYEYLQNHPETALVGTAYKKFGEINRFKVVKNPADDSAIRSLLLFRAPIHHPTVMYRRTLLQENQIRYNEKFISLNDRQLYFDVAKYGKLANMSDMLYKYRFHKKMTSKVLKNKIKEERKIFHQMWFDYHDIKLTPAEKHVFDDYVTTGRCRIKDYDTLTAVCDLLEKLNNTNKQKHFLPEAEFAAVCAEYLIKRCVNAACYGAVNSEKILQNTSLPVQSGMFLKICNLALHWRA